MTSALIYQTQVLAVYDGNPPSSISRDAANGLPRLSVSGASVGWSDGNGFAIIPATYTDTQPSNTVQAAFDAPTLAQWTVLNGVASGPRTWQTVTPSVPQSVTNAQARGVLMKTPSPTEQGKTFCQSIDAYCVAQGDIVYMAWEYVNDFTRNGVMVEQVLKAQFAQTDSQIDALFTAASAVTF
jgi:hypothetical protein